MCGFIMATSSKVCLLVSFLIITVVFGQDGNANERRRATRVVRARGIEEPSNLIGPGIRATSSVEVNTTQLSDVQEVEKANTPSPHTENRPRMDGSLANIAALLQRQSERLSVLQSLAEQQMRRLDGLEYRLTRLEVQTQERAEATRVALGEATRHVQTLTYQGGQLTSAIDSIRQTQTEERQTLTLLASAISTTQSGQTSIGSGIISTPTEVLTRLQTISNSIQGLRTAVSGLNDQNIIFSRNFSDLANSTRQINAGQLQLATKHGLSASLAELRASVTLTCPTKTTLQETRKLPADCSIIQREEGHNKSGVYLIQPRNSHQPFFTYCDFVSRGGGWTVIQNRYEGTVDFFRDWKDYKRGFGNLGGEFWLGLDKLHHLTNSEVNELLIELQDFTLDTAYAHYSSFAVGPEVEDYPISFLAGYDGDAGDSLVYHAGMKFSTRDADNDQWIDGNCADSHIGAWWYNGCDTSNLNGRYLNGAVPESHEYQGMYWYDWRGPTYSLMRTRMMIRPRSFLETKIPTVNNKSTTMTVKTPPAKRVGRQKTTTPATTTESLDVQTEPTEKESVQE